MMHRIFLIHNSWVRFDRQTDTVVFNKIDIIATAVGKFSTVREFWNQN